MFLECFAPMAALPLHPGFEPHPLADRARAVLPGDRDRDTLLALPADFRSESFAEDLLGAASGW